LIGQASRLGPNVSILVERLMRDRPHPEQGYRSAMGVLSLARRYERDRVEGACERALAINAVSYSSADKKRGPRKPTKPAVRDLVKPASGN
jgi:transposase